MVERQLPKLHTRVRFPSPAPKPLPERICVKNQPTLGQESHTKSHIVKDNSLSFVVVCLYVIRVMAKTHQH
jgi:hypothetical protein